MEKANIKSYDTSPKIRYAWVDYAKFFSIFLVVSYHIPHRADGYVGELLSLLRMPAFFMIAGFLFNTNKFHSLSYFLKHRSIQLLIPYTSFFTFFYISWLLFGRDWIGGNELDIPLWKPLMEFAYGTPVTIIAPYWFICCLFSMQIIYYLLIRQFPKPIVIIIVSICPLLHCIPWTSYLPWNLSAALLYIPFYAFSNMNKDFIQSLTSKHILGAIIAFCITLVCIRYGNYSNMIFKNIQIVICGLLVMPIYTIFIKAFSHLKIGKAVSFIGKNTIIILALQNYIIGCFKLYFKSIIEYGGYATNIILTLLTIIICCLPIKLINSYVPFLVGRGPYFEKKLNKTKT